jgi:hypothetical protein
VAFSGRGAFGLPWLSAKSAGGMIDMRYAMRFKLLAPLALALALTGLPSAMAQTTGAISRASQTNSSNTYTNEEILAAGHEFFGKTSRGIAKAVEYVFQNQGQPTAYIVGEEGAGAFVGGLRYGEGTIYYKSGLKQHIFWQGPSVGFDFGGNGSRTMTLVYNSTYLVGGVGVNFQEHDNIVLAPIRTGLGARLGANIGYLKYSGRADWNPF